MEPTHSVILDNIGKRFGRTILFRKISLEMNTGEIVAITGWNGSGKSTLLRIIAGLGRPSAGTIRMLVNGKPVSADAKRNFVGLIAPALNLYDELTAHENLSFLAHVRGVHRTHQEIDALIRKVGLGAWENEYYGIFSSGMKQRLKLAQALLHNPPLLLFDEPFSNLDTKGIAVVDEIIHSHRRQGMMIIASNEQREIAYADRVINLSE